MKTVGQIIHAERVKRNISLEHLSHLTRIDIKYLSAIEADDYALLPSETFAKGFIRNIALRLDRDPQELVAIFRRDYKLPNKNNYLKSRSAKFNFSKISLLQFAPYVLGVIVFFLYLIFQFRVVLTPPNLEIISPKPDSVLVSPFTIEGNTSIDAYLFIGDDVQIRPDENGHFAAKLNLPLGETEVIVKSTNRFSRSTVRKLPLTIISK